MWWLLVAQGNVVACMLELFNEQNHLRVRSTHLTISKNRSVLFLGFFSFPGGRRFHFADPNGNEYAVWSGVNA